MANRSRQLKVSAINLAFVDAASRNKPRAYCDLLRAIFESRTFVPLRGDRHMAIGSLYEDENDESILRGVLYGVTSIDELAWFNLNEHRPASEAERNRISVPEDMAANYREYDYEFRSKLHRLVFLTREGSLRVSAVQTRYVFERLCKQPPIVDRFGDVSVSIEQEPEKLAAILDAGDLRALSILVRRPNSGLGGFDADFEKRLEKLGASQVQAEYKAATGDRLRPDDPIRRAAKVALSDGVVTATIRKDGITQDVSTESFPVVETVTYNPDKESRLLALRRAVEKIMARIKKVAK